MLETLGKYKILDRIPAAGATEVYRARDTQLGRTVAIKILPAETARDPQFQRDARTALALSHPNIAALYETGDHEGRPYLVAEFVPGDPLKSLIAGQPLNVRRAIDLGVQIADALADAYGAGVVHGGLSPDTIVVTPKGNAKVLDFGLVRWTAGGAPAAADMSPEQALGERIDHRSDIFSLGVVLFEMLTGKLPFSGPSPDQTALQIIQAPAPAPSAVNRSLPAEIDPIVGRALAKSFDQRYEAAATVAAELRSVAAILDVRLDAVEPPAIGAVRSQTTPVGLWLLLFAALVLAVAATWWWTR